MNTYFHYNGVQSANRAGRWHTLPSFAREQTVRSEELMFIYTKLIDMKLVPVMHLTALSSIENETTEYLVMLLLAGCCVCLGLLPFFAAA